MSNHTYTERVIREAVGSGYGAPHAQINGDIIAYLPTNNRSEMFLSPSFWSALGRARGWEDCRCEQCHDVFPEYHNGCVRCGKSVRPDGFNRYHWHCFIEHLIAGKDAESYFAEMYKGV
jgi:hypothetical protein